jgi:GNAT superfamily N-acetyltransferase
MQRACARARNGQYPARDRAPLSEHIAESRGPAGLDRVEEVHCRTAGAEDFPFLATMLGEAAVWRPDKPTPTADEVMADPRYAMYLTEWPRRGDYGLVAEQDGPVGAAWYRTYTEANHGYGFVAEDVPELSIAVIAARRHEGIGRRLLVGLIEASIAQGYAALSLSVNSANPAYGLYESVGFQPVENRESSTTMVRHAGNSN